MQTVRFATKPMTDCLLMLRNERWKRVRTILTPSFSAAKMKEVRNALIHQLEKLILHFAPKNVLSALQACFVGARRVHSPEAN